MLPLRSKRFVQGTVNAGILVLMGAPEQSRAVMCQTSCENEAVNVTAPVYENLLDSTADCSADGVTAPKRLTEGAFVRSGSSADIIQGAKGSVTGECIMRVPMLSPLPGIVRVLPAVVTLAVNIQTQAPPTLRDRALASAGRPISLPVINETEPATITELAANADLVVEGRLRPIKSYLSPDEYYIYTDFEVLPTQVVLDEENATARIPGSGQTAIVTLLGGELMIEGTKVTMIDNDLSPFSDTSTLLMFLKRTAAPGRRYSLYRSAAGVFEIDDKRNIRALLRDYPNEEIRGQQVEDIVAKIRSVRRKERPVPSS